MALKIESAAGMVRLKVEGDDTSRYEGRIVVRREGQMIEGYFEAEQLLELGEYLVEHYEGYRA